MRSSWKPFTKASYRLAGQFSWSAAGIGCDIFLDRGRRQAGSDGVRCLMQLHGIHHLTAITANARGNYDFYTDVLGMRLVKKTVNQDDVSAYHLFYADGKGSPGTDLTFFVWPATP